MKPMQPQRHHPGRRLRHPPAPGHAGHQQAAAAGVRQADGLLPAQHADAGRHPRHPGHQHAAGHAALRAAAGRRQPVGHEPAATACSPAPTAWRRPSSSARLRRRRTPARWCWATTSSTATTSAAAGARRRRATGATVFAYHVHDPERYGVVEFDARRRASASRKSPAAQEQLRRHRPVLLRRAGVRHRRQASSPAPRGELEITEVNATYLEQGPARRGDHGPRLRLAGHRHPRQPAGSRPVHRHAGKAPGPEGRLPGRDRLAQGWIDACGRS
jgi:hypothetical protein